MARSIPPGGPRRWRSSSGSGPGPRYCGRRGMQGGPMPEQRVGTVVHYFKGPSVAVVRLTEGTLAVGERIRFHGADRVDGSEPSESPAGQGGRRGRHPGGRPHPPARSGLQGDPMNEEAFNLSVRKFLKDFGVTAQREIEKSVDAALKAGKLKGTETLKARARLEIQGLPTNLVIEHDITLA